MIRREIDFDFGHLLFRFRTFFDCNNVTHKHVTIVGDLVQTNANHGAIISLNNKQYEK